MMMVNKEEQRDLPLIPWVKEGMKNEMKRETRQEENERNDLHILTKGKCFWQGAEYDLVDSNFGVFVASEHVIACDPWEIVLDYKPGTKHFALPK